MSAAKSRLALAGASLGEAVTRADHYGRLCLPCRASGNSRCTEQPGGLQTFIAADAAGEVQPRFIVGTSYGFA